MKTLTWYLDDALVQMRDDADLTQGELAAKIDVSRNSVTNYENAATKPKWTTVQRWAEACDYDPGDNTLRALWESWIPVIQRYSELEWAA